MCKEDTPRGGVLGENATEEWAKRKAKVDCCHAIAKDLTPFMKGINGCQDGDPGAENHGGPDTLEDPSSYEHTY